MLLQLNVQAVIHIRAISIRYRTGLNTPIARSIIIAFIAVRYTGCIISPVAPNEEGKPSGNLNQIKCVAGQQVNIPFKSQQPKSRSERGSNKVSHHSDTHAKTEDRNNITSYPYGLCQDVLLALLVIVSNLNLHLNHHILSTVCNTSIYPPLSLNKQP
jgi:hypothetical protein